MKPWKLPIGSVAVVLALLAASAAPASGFPVALLTPASFGYGQSTSLAGGGAGPDALVLLQASPYPFRGFAQIGHTVAAPDGSFAFPRLRPDRNTRYRVIGADGARSAAVDAIVSAPATQIVRHLRDGSVQITLRSSHARDLRWGGQPVRWFAAAVGSRHFALVAESRTRDLRPGLTLARANFFAPRGQFVFRACFNAPGEAAMGPPAAHTRCPRRDFLSLRAAR